MEDTSRLNFQKVKITSTREDKTVAGSGGY